MFPSAYTAQEIGSEEQYANCVCRIQSYERSWTTMRTKSGGSWPVSLEQVSHPQLVGNAPSSSGAIRRRKLAHHHHHRLSLLPLLPRSLVEGTMHKSFDGNKSASLGYAGVQDNMRDAFCYDIL
jgi:hypothetical protein